MTPKCRENPSGRTGVIRKQLANPRDPALYDLVSLNRERVKSAGDISLDLLRVAEFVDYVVLRDHHASIAETSASARSRLLDSLSATNKRPRRRCLRMFKLRRIAEHFDMVRLHDSSIM